MTEESTQQQTKKTEGFWQYVKKQFFKSRVSRYSYYIVVFLAAIAILADFLANEKPLVAHTEGSLHFPVVQDYGVAVGIYERPEYLQGLRGMDWREVEYDFVIWPPVPYLPQNLDFQNAHFASPFDEQRVESMRFHHFLGTDEMGRDVLSGMIHGTRIAFLVGIVAMGLATLIGVFFGALAGYLGDSRLRLTRAAIFLNIIFFFIAFFYAFTVRGYTISDAMGESYLAFAWETLLSLIIFVGIMGIGNFLGYLFKPVPFLGTKIPVPVDILVSRLIEVVVAIPALFLILAIVGIAEPSVILVMAVLGLVLWPGIARFTRAEILRIRNLEYMEAAEALGYSRWRAVIRHALPNALSPVFIAVAFGIATAILMESMLSFLGVGVSADTITWGSLLSDARHTPEAWWIAIFPGFAIFITVTVFNLIGDGLNDALDPRQKQ